MSFSITLLAVHLPAWRMFGRKLEKEEPEILSEILPSINVFFSIIFRVHCSQKLSPFNSRPLFDWKYFENQSWTWRPQTDLRIISHAATISLNMLNPSHRQETALMLSFKLAADRFQPLKIRRRCGRPLGYLAVR